METRGDILKNKQQNKGETPSGEAELTGQDRRPLYSPINDPEKFPTQKGKGRNSRGAS